MHLRPTTKCVQPEIVRGECISGRFFLAWGPDATYIHLSVCECVYMLCLCVCVCWIGQSLQYVPLAFLSAYCRGRFLVSLWWNFNRFLRVRLFYIAVGQKAPAVTKLPLYTSIYIHTLSAYATQSDRQSIRLSVCLCNRFVAFRLCHSLLICIDGAECKKKKWCITVIGLVNVIIDISCTCLTQHIFLFLPSQPKCKWGKYTHTITHTHILSKWEAKQTEENASHAICKR